MSDSAGSVTRTLVALNRHMQVMQVMIRIIKSRETLIKIFSFMLDSLFECIYKAVSARDLSAAVDTVDHTLTLTFLKEMF